MSFEHAQLPTIGFLSGSPRIDFTSFEWARIPWSQGKTQGILSISAAPYEKHLENVCYFSILRMNSLREYARAQGIFSGAQGIFGPEQGI